MSDYAKFWQWLIAALDAHDPVTLLIVTESVGSSPGKVGAKMAVTAQCCIGTIGGGPVESGLMQTARSLLNDVGARPQIFRLAHHPTETRQTSGMICGGEQTVLLYPCRPDDRPLFGQLLECCRRGTPLTLCISGHGLQVLPAELNLPATFSGDDDWCYRETIGLRKRAYIIGGGHVGLALSKVLDMLDFDITVIDEREQLDSMQANIYAEQKWRIPYSEIAEHIPEGADVFVFIMTHHHHGDELVLTQLAGKRLAYLGLLGSRHKIAELKNSLIHKLPADQLQRLRAPIGLAIKSHTPAEIAISIAAELIQLNNSQTI